MYTYFLAESFLAVTFQNAAYAVNNTASYNSARIKEARECLTFIQGSGLENTLLIFGLNVDASYLRNIFWGKVRSGNDISCITVISGQ